MTQTDAMAFRRKFSESVRKAQTGPVEITRNGRRDLVLMSADHYDWLRAAAQRTHRTEDAVAVVVKAVQRAEMDPVFTYLDELVH